MATDFEISYLRKDPWLGEIEENNHFSGSWEELWAMIGALKNLGCYGIMVSDVTPAWYEDEADLAE